MSTARKIRIALIISLASFLLTLCGIELWLRAFFPKYRVYTQPDDLLGYSFIPGAYYDFVAIEKCPDMHTTGYVNSHGLIDDEHSYEYPAATFRILALGDSQTEALQVERQYRWTDRLETQLGAQGDFPVEVINAGRSGMGTALQYLYYTERGYRYNPDLVILVFTYNDFMDNSYALLPDARPYFVLQDNELVLDTGFRNHPEYDRLKQTEWARQNFFIVSFVRERLSIFRQQQALQQAGLDAVSTIDAPPKDAATPQAPSQDAVRDAVDVTMRLILKLHDAVKANGSEFVFVIATVFSDAATLQAFHTLYPELEFETADEAMTQWAMMRGMHVLNLRPSFSEFEEQTGIKTGGCAESGYMGHWNTSGHEQVAKWIEEYLIAESLVPEAGN